MATLRVDRLAEPPPEGGVDREGPGGPGSDARPTPDNPRSGRGWRGTRREAIYQFGGSACQSGREGINFDI